MSAQMQIETFTSHPEIREMLETVIPPEDLDPREDDRRITFWLRLTQLPSLVAMAREISAGTRFHLTYRSRES